MILNTIVFLQNAWSALYAGGYWPRQSWVYALERSRSGQRLREMIDDFDDCENTTPRIGKTPAEKFPPDLDYIREILENRQPDQLVACGRQAERALLHTWPGPLLIVPHPAFRLLTSELYREARRQIERGLTGQSMLVQLRDRIVHVPLKQNEEERKWLKQNRPQ